MKISVIIPVYNAAAYVTQAVESALAQLETAEVLLIEDGSPDNALEVCQALTGKYDKVRLLRHPNGENRGAGASRNLGLTNAQFEFIAFLDADDYYLPGRFAQAINVFEDHPDCEGVYGAVAMYVEDEEGWQRWEESGKSQESVKTVNELISPEELGVGLIRGSKGYFHLDSLVIKKVVLEKSGFMNEDLRVHQDTDFMVRAALTARLYPGSIDKPIAMWRVHDANRISAPRSLRVQFRDRMKYWMSLYRWSKENAGKDVQEHIRMSTIRYVKTQRCFDSFPRKLLPVKLTLLARLLRLLGYPEIILDGIKK